VSGTTGTTAASDGAPSAQVSLGNDAGQAASNEQVAAPTDAPVAAAAADTAPTTPGTGAAVNTAGSTDDVIAGTSGADFLTGGAGSDTFVWHAGELGAVDTITDFTAGEHGDVLAIGALLNGYSAGSDLSQFVHVTESAGGTMVSIDPTGHGEFHDLVLLQGVTGVDPGTLMGHITPYPLA
jgi:hypothetical protein